MNDLVPAPIKPTITLADLDKLDIRAGTIETVDCIAGSEKLVKLTVEFGDKRRVVLASLRNARPEGGNRGPPGTLCRKPRAATNGGPCIRGDAVRHRLRRWHHRTNPPMGRDTRVPSGKPRSIARVIRSMFSAKTRRTRRKWLSYPPQDSRKKPAFDDAGVARLHHAAAEKGARVAKGAWFGEEARVFRLGFGLLAMAELGDALGALTAAFKETATAGGRP